MVQLVVSASLFDKIIIFIHFGWTDDINNSLNGGNFLLEHTSEAS
jgi:hypothetical protein